METKQKRKNDQRDPGCLLPLLLFGATFFGSLLAYELFLWVERGL